MLTLDQIETVALAGLVLFAGYGIRRLIPVLARYNIPAPVVGGLLMAALITAARQWNWTPLAFTTTLQTPLMIAFFTTVGFGASLSLLRVGGPAVLLFFVLSTLMAVLQNVIGVAASYALGQHPLMGVLAGSVTLTGGPATGLAFAPQFEAAGVPAAATLAARWRRGSSRACDGAPSRCIRTPHAASPRPSWKTGSIASRWLPPPARTSSPTPC
jgi:ESS family glutamate:Na+ symporter